MFALAIGSIPIFILGAIIWKFKVVEIIAGYDESKTTDKDGMAKWVGMCLMLTSVIMFALYFILSKTDLENGILIIISISVLLVMLTITALGTRRYERR